MLFRSQMLLNARLICAFRLENYGNRLKNKFDIGYNTHILDIFKIKLNTLIPLDVGSSANLPIAGKTWLYNKSLLLVSIACFHLIYKNGSWTDDTHIALDDVDKLRKLVY